MQLELKLIKLWLTKQATLRLRFGTNVTTHATDKQTHVVHLVSVQQKYVQYTRGWRPISLHFVPRSVYAASESWLSWREKSRELRQTVDSSGSFKKHRCGGVENTTPYRLAWPWRNAERLQINAQFSRTNNPGQLPQQHFLRSDDSPLIWGDSTKTLRKHCEHRWPGVRRPWDDLLLHTLILAGEWAG